MTRVGGSVRTRRSDVDERNQRRREAAVAAATTGGFPSLALALLGPSSPPAGPPTRTAQVMAPVPVSIPPSARRGTTAEPAAGTQLYECRTAALGYRAYLGLIGRDPSALYEARARLGELADKWSPTARGSEIRRLNDRRGVAQAVSADTLLLAELASRWADQGKSIFVDSRHGTVGVMSATPWDVTALAAALAADLVVSDMIDAGAEGAFVRVGDAVRAAGASPRRGGWLTTARSRNRTPATPLRLQQGAAVTDCRAGRGPAAVEGRPLAVTVVADHAWRARTLVSAALGAPSRRARALLAAGASAACVLGPDGRAVTIGRWGDFRTPVA